MKLITIANFRKWLERLPQDRPFCHNGKCPLVMYGGTHATYRHNYGKISWRDPFMRLIDRECSFDWRSVTAKQCLDVLNKVA